jgi:hypothetical protein
MELDSTYFLLHYLLARAHARRGALAKAGAILKKIGENFDKIRLIAMGAGLVHAVTDAKSRPAPFSGDSVPRPTSATFPPLTSELSAPQPATPKRPSSGWRKPTKNAPMV